MLYLKDISKPIGEAELIELIDEHKEFDNWLKQYKKISNYQNARFDREKRRTKLKEIINKSPKPITLKRIAETIEIDIEQGKDIDIIQDIIEFFKDRLGIEIREEEISETERTATPLGVATIVPSELKLIGRVAPTLRSPATPNEFSFWLEDNRDISLETGALVTARGDGGVRITGLVSEIKAISDYESVIDSFYAHSLGRPDLEMPTKIPVVMDARVEVIRRSDSRTEPVRGPWPVTFATAKEIREAYGAEILPEHEVLAGFTHDDKKNPVPIGIDARYVVGYEAAHINISGASGIATKTSYALFLLYGLLAYSNCSNDSVAAIAFNVKEADLMFIDMLPNSWDDIEQIKHHARLGPSIKLWIQAKNDYKIDPISWAKNNKFEFYAPMHFSSKGGKLSQRNDEKVKAFNYGLNTLIRTGVGSLYTLFDVDDLDEKALSLIASMSEVSYKEGLSFESLIHKLEESLRGGDRRGGDRGDWFLFGNATHHKATAHKILNRMKHAINSQLKGVILKNENTDHPIPINELRPGKLWVIDITQLSDKGQRLIFQTVVRTVFQKLEERKTLELTGQLEGELSNFPKHVVIFVDELNKFVPSGREYSALKGEIVEMAARGRSVGMALCGAQQLASKVDEEVLANTSTFVVGRSHAVEIRKPPYAWLTEGLKERAMVLDKGSLLLWHSLHKRPVLIYFPLPMHKIYEEIK